VQSGTVDTFFLPLRVGWQAVPAPVQFGISYRAIARYEIPNLKVSLCRVDDARRTALATKASALVAAEPSSIAGLIQNFDLLRGRSTRAKSKFKWQWRHATAPRVVEERFYWAYRAGRHALKLGCKGTGFSWGEHVVFARAPVFVVEQKFKGEWGVGIDFERDDPLGTAEAVHREPAFPA